MPRTISDGMNKQNLDEICSSSNMNSRGGDYPLFLILQKNNLYFIFDMCLNR